MEKQRGIKALSIVALFVAVIGLTVAFAAMSRTLEIKGTATMDTAKWDIHFENLSAASLSGAAVENTAPTIKADGNNVANTVIGDYAVTLTKPGDKVVYTFDVVNEGTIDAKIGTFTKNASDALTCTSMPEAGGEEKPDDAALVCRNLTYTLKYTGTDTEVAANDTLNANETKNLTLTLEYNASATELPTDDVKIEGLGITMVYVQN